MSVQIVAYGHDLIVALSKAPPFAATCDACGQEADVVRVHVEGPAVADTPRDSRMTDWCPGCLAGALAVRLMALHARRTGALPHRHPDLRRIDT